MKKSPLIWMQKENLKGLVSYVKNESKTKTTDFTRGKIHERVKLFSMQRNIGYFHKDFYIKQIEKLAYHRSYYKRLGKHHVADVRYKAFDSTPGDISTRSDYAVGATAGVTAAAVEQQRSDNGLITER